MELADYADLSTIMSNMNHRRAGYPFASTVDFATDADGRGGGGKERGAVGGAECGVQGAGCGAWGRGAWGCGVWVLDYRLYDARCKM